MDESNGWNAFLGPLGYGLVHATREARQGKDEDERMSYWDRCTAPSHPSRNPHTIDPSLL